MADELYVVTKEDMESVANSIRAKAGTTEKILWPDGFKSTVENISSGGGGEAAPSAKRSDVTFIDYDGSVLYSYTLAEAQALTALPDGPTHDGLVFQGWNLSLEKINALTRPMNVGAMHITDDGKTRLYIRIAAEGRMNVPLYIYQTVANGVTIDWGDGSAAETLEGTGNVNTTHTYAEPGYYVISLMPEDGCTLSFGASTSSYCLMGSTGNNGRVYCNMLKEVYVGKNVTSIGNSAFKNCSSLASITIPDGVTSIGDNAFQSCFSLASITIPDGVTSIGNNAFASCYSLASIAIPDGVTSIGNSAIAYCSSLASITIPDGVTSIGNNAFQNCFSLASIAIPDGVTSIGNNAIAYCYSLASIAIPDGVTSIGKSAIAYCFSLASITIPDGVTSIGDNAFQSCFGIRYYDFSACTNVPTLSNTKAFSNIQSDCQMLIPAALYDKWSAATNWATYASHMVAV